MNQLAVVWIFAAAGVALFLAFICWTIVSQNKTKRGSIHSSWFVATVACTGVTIFIASKVMDLSPDVTIVDVGALTVAAVSAGLFLGFSLMSHELDKSPR